MQVPSARTRAHGACRLWCRGSRTRERIRLHRGSGFRRAPGPDVPSLGFVGPCAQGVRHESLDGAMEA